jgi:hypothetical protein
MRSEQAKLGRTTEKSPVWRRRCLAHLARGLSLNAEPLQSSLLRLEKNVRTEVVARCAAALHESDREQGKAVPLHSTVYSMISGDEKPMR